MVLSSRLQNSLTHHGLKFWQRGVFYLENITEYYHIERYVQLQVFVHAILQFQ